MCGLIKNYYNALTPIPSLLPVPTVHKDCCFCVHTYAAAYRRTQRPPISYTSRVAPLNCKKKSGEPSSLYKRVEAEETPQIDRYNVENKLIRLKIMMAPKNVKLTYIDGRGRAELARILLVKTKQYCSNYTK